MAQQAEGWSRSVMGRTHRLSGTWKGHESLWDWTRRGKGINAYLKRTQACFRTPRSGRWTSVPEQARALSISWINHIVCACSSSSKCSPAGSFLKRAHQRDAMMSFPHCQYGSRAVGNVFDPLRLCTSILCSSVHYLIETHKFLPTTAFRFFFKGVRNKQ